MKKNTTFKCPVEISTRIKKTATEEGLYISEFILMALDKRLPLENIPRLKKQDLETTEKIGVIIPESIQTRIDHTIKTLSSDIRSVKQWEVIVQCAVLFCEEYDMHA